MTIREKVLASVPWALVEAGSSTALGLVSMLVLSRLLTPAEFGAAGLALAFGQYGDLIIGSLLTGSLIQRRELSQRVLDTAVWTALALGAVASLGCWIAAGPVARLYDQPELADYIAVLGLSPLFTGASLLPQALLARQLTLRSYALRALASRGLGVGFTIALAAMGLRGWSIILGTLVSGLSFMVLFWSAGFRRPRLQFSLETCFELLSFGWPITSQELLISAANRFFPLLVGLFHGTEAVGYLTFASRLVEPVAEILGTGANRLGLPMFAALQGQVHAVQRAFRSATRYSFAFVAPALVGIGAVAQDAIPPLFGDEWRPAVVVVEIIALYRAAMFTRVFAVPCVAALGAPRRNLVTATITALAVIAGALATQNTGMTIVMLVWAGRSLFGIPVGVYQVRVVTQLSAGAQFEPFIPSLLACAGMFCAVQFARYFVAGLGLESLAVSVPVGIATYLLLIWLFDPSLVTQVLALVRANAFSRGETHAI